MLDERLEKLDYSPLKDRHPILTTWQRIKTHFVYGNDPDIDYIEYRHSLEPYFTNVEMLLTDENYDEKKVFIQIEALVYQHWYQQQLLERKHLNADVKTDIEKLTAQLKVLNKQLDLALRSSHVNDLLNKIAFLLTKIHLKQSESKPTFWQWLWK